MRCCLQPCPIYSSFSSPPALGVDLCVPLWVSVCVVPCLGERGHLLGETVPYVVTRTHWCWSNGWMLKIKLSSSAYTRRPSSGKCVCVCRSQRVVVVRKDGCLYSANSCNIWQINDRRTHNIERAFAIDFLGSIFYRRYCLLPLAVEYFMGFAILRWDHYKQLAKGTGGRVWSRHKTKPFVWKSVLIALKLYTETRLRGVAAKDAIVVLRCVFILFAQHPARRSSRFEYCRSLIWSVWLMEPVFCSASIGGTKAELLFKCKLMRIHLPSSTALFCYDSYFYAF